MALASKDVEYQLATLEGDGPLCDWIRDQGSQPLVLGSGMSYKTGLSFVAFWRLLRYVREYPVDIIYICGARAAFVLRFLKVFFPGVKHVHGIRWNPDSNSRLDRFFRLMERQTHPLIDAWITNSKIAKQTLVSQCRIPDDKVTVIYNGLESLPKDVPPLNERPTEVLTVANLNPRKGHQAYLRTIREVVKNVPDARFVFVGRDDMKGEVQRSIDEAGLAEFVHCEGFQADVSTWLRRARLMVLPSLWGEGCPTSILEGYAYGLPIVAYAIDGIPELIDDGIDGVVVSPNKPDELASAIVRVLENPVRAESMGMVGREKVASRFTLAHCADEHARIFHKLIRS